MQNIATCKFRMREVCVTFCNIQSTDKDLSLGRIAIKMTHALTSIRLYVTRFNGSDHLHVFTACTICESGSTVVMVLWYKSEGHWFDSRWCHWNFSLT